MMYRGYQVELDDLETRESIDISNYIDFGRKLHEINRMRVKKNLDSFKDRNGNLSASQIIGGWFPPIKADVFLSHSHKDADIVLGLSGFLYQNFKLRSFIDSCIWGYSDALLELIDNTYCYQASRDTYSYRKRNRSTSHVHMMVLIALMKMIHNCECVMFVDTPNSISPKDYINGGNETDSPWIYSEISMTSLVQRRSLEAHRGLVVKSARALDELAEPLQIKYDLDLSHLFPLSGTQFAKWHECNKTGKGALDALYNLGDANHG